MGTGSPLGCGVVISNPSRGCMKIQGLLFSLAPHLGLMKVGLNQTVGERLTNSLLLLSDKAVPTEMMENNEPWKAQ